MTIDVARVDVADGGAIVVAWRVPFPRMPGWNARSVWPRRRHLHRHRRDPVVAEGGDGPWRDERPVAGAVGGRAARCPPHRGLAAAAIGLAVLTLHHERKSGGEVGGSGRGSSAFAGAVDIVLSLRRGEGATRPTIRHLHGLSRFDATPPRLVVELTAAGYVAHGTEPAVARVEAQDAILAALPDDEAAALSVRELRRATGAADGAVRAALQALVATGDGQGGSYRHWRRPAPG